MLASNPLQGWGSTNPVFTQAITHLQPKTIVEVGTWKGASALHIANVCRDLDLAAAVVCVDTWLGSPEHFLQRDKPEGWQSLHVKHGYPQLY